MGPFKTQLLHVALPICFSLSLLFQGIKQHNPAAYVLNKTVAKHRVAAAPGTTSTTKPDSLNPNTDAVAVRFICLFMCVRVSAGEWNLSPFNKEQ